MTVKVTNTNYILPFQKTDFVLIQIPTKKIFEFIGILTHASFTEMSQHLDSGAIIILACHFHG